VLSRLLSRPALLLIEPVLRRFVPHLNRAALELFVQPLQLLLALAFFRAGMEWVGPSARLQLYLGRTLALLFFSGLAWLCLIIVNVVIHRLTRSCRRSTRPCRTHR